MDNRLEIINCFFFLRYNEEEDFDEGIFFFRNVKLYLDLFFLMVYLFIIFIENFVKEFFVEFICCLFVIYII